MADDVKPPEPGTPQTAPLVPVSPAWTQSRAGATPSPPPPPPSPVPAIPPGYAVAVPVWRSLRGLKTALTWLFALVAIGAVVSVASYANRLSVINDIEHRTFGSDIVDRANSSDDFVSAANIAIAVLMLAIFVCFIIWIWRAAKNNEALGRPQPRLGSGWAIGGWFIPLANLVIPVLVAQDLWRGSDASVPRGDIRWKIAPRSALVGWWWGLFLVSFLRGSSSSNNLNTFSELRTSDTLSLIGRVFVIGAAVLAILVVRRISERQEACLASQQAAWTSQQGGSSAPSA